MIRSRIKELIFNTDSGVVDSQLVDVETVDFDALNYQARFIFWLHISAIFIAVILGFIFSPLIMVALAIFHRAHVFLFEECILSRIQRIFGGLPKNMSFIQFAYQKFFNGTISLKQSQLADYFFVSLALVISIIKAV